MTSTMEAVTPSPAQVAAGTDRFPRFTRTERAVHWTQAASFLALTISGFALALPPVEATFGHRALLREIHLCAAFFFFFGPALVALSADRRSMRQDVEAVDRWDGDDFLWLVPSPVLRAFGRRTPPQGRFNAGQKLNAVFVVASTLLFSATGLVLWQNRRFPIDLVERANAIHTALAYLALVAFLGHLFYATIYPKTRPAFRAITEGWVRRDWALHHHAKWVRAAVLAPPPPLYDGVRAALQIVLGAAACLFATRVLFFSLGANVTDPVTTWLYDLTAWPGTTGIQQQTGVRVTDWPGMAYLGLLISAWLLVDQLRRLQRVNPSNR